MYAKLLSIFYFILTLHLLNAQLTCDQIGHLIYEDMGCTPVYDNSSMCPIRYECDLGSNNGSCIFNNQYYEAGEQVPNELLHEMCYTDCFCTEQGTFECAEIKCDHHFNPAEPGCYWEFLMDKCCSIGQHCPEENRYCDIGSKIVREGQLFNPPHTCYRCICQESHNETYDEAYCKRMTCGTQLVYGDRILKRCAPTYNIVADPNHHALCCPVEWTCPDPEDDVNDEVEEPTEDDEPTVDEDPDIFCEYGTKKYKIGESFQGPGLFRTCTCRIPPLMTCTKY